MSTCANTRRRSKRSTAGNWDEAFALLHAVPHWDQGADFLTSHILLHKRQPPPDWDGVINLDSK